MTAPGNVNPSVLEEQKAYYNARAAEYDEWFYRKDRYDRGPEVNLRWHSEADIVSNALDSFCLSGHVLELAPGTGIWTQRLVKTADAVTALDASEQMIQVNRAKVQSGKVEYVQADIFSWQPDRQYDGVFFGFWLSHVPMERVNCFLGTVATALRPGGKVFFVDSRPEQTMSAKEHQLPKRGSQVMQRILNDGSSFAIVKNFFEPDDLTARCANVSLQMDISLTPTYFIYGSGFRQ